MTEERRPQHHEGVPVKEHLEAIIADFRKHVDDKFDAMESRNIERFRASEAAVNAALSAADKAVDKTETNAEKWRSDANEWRAAMSDRERNFQSKSEAEIANRSLEEKIADLRESRDKSAGGTIGLDRLIAIAVALVAIAGFVYLLVTGHR